MNPNSVSMLKNLNEVKSLSLYSDWAHNVCAEKNIHINEALTHIKDGKLFCIATEVGDL